uniref:Uncharacterized protein n=1 Tax=Ditylenchus dipsaci TaxID=166011 RepID=A0A915ERU1_9BILA
MAKIQSRFNVLECDKNYGLALFLDARFKDRCVKDSNEFRHLIKQCSKRLSAYGRSNADVARVVPPINIYECFRELKSYLLREEPSLEPVIMWFSSYYVGTLMRPPPFPVHLWSCYNRTLAGQDRTNNFAEAAHRRLHTILGIDHRPLVISWAR